MLLWNIFHSMSQAKLTKRKCNMEYMTIDYVFGY